MITTLSVGTIEENVYIIDVGDDRGVIVDPGAEPERIVKALGKLKPICIALTHGHLDHIAAIPALLNALGPVPVAIHKDDAQYLGARSEETNRQSFNDIGAQSFFKENWSPMPEPDILLKDGEYIPGTYITVIHTPGHTKGSCCFYFKAESSLLSGDTLFQRGMGRTDSADSSLEAIRLSIREKILTLPFQTRVYPGHGGRTSVGAEKPLFIY
jgi:hydroxyacylglutathione hydrolase